MIGGRDCHSGEVNKTTKRKPIVYSPVIVASDIAFICVMHTLIRYSLQYLRTATENTHTDDPGTWQFDILINLFIYLNNMLFIFT